MRFARPVGRAWLGLLALLLLAGCSSMRLAYDPPPAGAGDRGPIRVVLEDARVAGKGGDDPLVVGFLRNAFGMPFAVRAAADREPSQVVRTLLEECLRSAGYRVVDGSEAAPQLSATLAEFWSDGYQHNRLWLVAPLALEARGSAAPTWSHELRVNQGWTARTAGFSQMQSGYDQLLRVTRDELVALFGSAEFRRGYAAAR